MRFLNPITIVCSTVYDRLCAFFIRRELSLFHFAKKKQRKSDMKDITSELAYQHYIEHTPDSILSSILPRSLLNSGIRFDL